MCVWSARIFTSASTYLTTCSNAEQACTPTAFLPGRASFGNLSSLRLPQTTLFTAFCHTSTSTASLRAGHAPNAYSRVMRVLGVCIHTKFVTAVASYKACERVCKRINEKCCGFNRTSLLFTAISLQTCPAARDQRISRHVITESFCA